LNKKILISGAYSTKNKGVMAMLESVVSNNKNHQFIFYCHKNDINYEIKSLEHLKNIEIFPILWYSKSYLNIIKLVFCLLGLDAYNLRKKHSLDVVIDINGDSLSKSYSTQSIFFTLLPVLSLRNKKNIEIIFGPQSVGPFRNKLAKLLVHIAIGNSNKFFLREKFSKKLIGNYLIGKVTGIIPDLAFSLTPNINNDLPRFNNYIGIGISALFDRYDSIKINEIIDFLLEKNEKIVLIAHVRHQYNNDLIKAQKILNDYSSKNIIVLEKDYKPSELKYIYSSFKCMISQRMHPCVLATSVKTPSFNLSYSEKSKGVIDDFFSPYSISSYGLNKIEIFESFKHWYEEIDNINTHKFNIVVDNVIDESNRFKL
jgi:polysaccharide pyruvyl transferase WcaK-like protein